MYTFYGRKAELAELNERFLGSRSIKRFILARDNFPIRVKEE